MLASCHRNLHFDVSLCLLRCAKVQLVAEHIIRLRLHGHHPAEERDCLPDLHEVIMSLAVDLHPASFHPGQLFRHRLHVSVSRLRFKLVIVCQNSTVVFKSKSLGLSQHRVCAGGRLKDCLLQLEIIGVERGLSRLCALNLLSRSQTDLLCKSLFLVFFQQKTFSRLQLGSSLRLFDFSSDLAEVRSPEALIGLVVGQLQGRLAELTNHAVREEISRLMGPHKLSRGLAVDQQLTEVLS